MLSTSESSPVSTCPLIHRKDPRQDGTSTEIHPSTERETDIAVVRHRQTPVIQTVQETAEVSQKLQVDRVVEVAHGVQRQTTDDPRRGVYREHLTVRTHAHIFLTAHFTRDHTCGSSIANCCESSQNISSSVMSLLNNPSTPFLLLFSSLVTSLTTLAVSRALSTAGRLRLCATLLGRELSGHLANFSPNTGYEPKLPECKFCNDMDSDHTPINLPNRNVSFPKEYAATITGWEDVNLPRHPGASSSSQQSAASRIHTLSKLDELGTSLTMVMANSEISVGSTCNMETCADMDREIVVSSLFDSVSWETRDRDLHVVQTLHDRQNLHEFLETGSSSRSWFKDEADVESKHWEKWNSDTANDVSYNRRISGLTCVGEE